MKNSQEKLNGFKEAFQFGLILLSVLLIGACQSTKFWSDTMEEVKFSQYQSYMIDDECSEYNPGLNPIHQIRIRNAIELELRELGYVRSDDPDITIKFFVKNETKYFYENCLPEYDDIIGGAQCVEKVHTYEEGTLIIDFIDTKENLAIYHGGAAGEPWDKLSNPNPTIKKMVRGIIQNYAELVSKEGYATR